MSCPMSCPRSCHTICMVSSEPAHCDSQVVGSMMCLHATNTSLQAGDGRGPGLTRLAWSCSDGMPADGHQPAADMFRSGYQTALFRQLCINAFLPYFSVQDTASADSTLNKYLLLYVVSYRHCPLCLHHIPDGWSCSSPDCCAGHACSATL